MQITKSIVVLLPAAVSALVVGCIGASAVHADIQRESKTPFVKIISMTKQEAESAVLGKPTRDDETWTGEGANAHPSGEHICDYVPFAGTVSTHIVWGTGGKPQIELSFKKDVTWQKAAEIIGLDPTKLTFKNEEQGAGTINGHGVKGFDFYYAGYMHKNRSNGMLTNDEGHGLPLLAIDPK